jgi:hypothetical protein
VLSNPTGGPEQSKRAAQQLSDANSEIPKALAGGAQKVRRHSRQLSRCDAGPPMQSAQNVTCWPHAGHVGTHTKHVQLSPAVMASLWFGAHAVVADLVHVWRFYQRDSMVIRRPRSPSQARPSTALTSPRCSATSALATCRASPAPRCHCCSRVVLDGMWSSHVLYSHHSRARAQSGTAETVVGHGSHGAAAPNAGAIVHCTFHCQLGHALQSKKADPDQAVTASDILPCDS